MITEQEQTPDFGAKNAQTLEELRQRATVLADSRQRAVICFDKATDHTLDAEKVALPPALGLVRAADLATEAHILHGVASMLHTDPHVSSEAAHGIISKIRRQFETPDPLTAPKPPQGIADRTRRIGGGK